MREKILHFLHVTGMSRTQFGYECVGDPAFVKRVEEGRKVRPKTAQKIEKFIAERTPK